MNLIFLLLFFVMFSPLIGVVMMENGAYSISTGLFGYENGITFPYIIFTFIFFLTIFLTQKVCIPIKFRHEANNLEYNLRKVLKIVLLFNLIVLFIMLFLFSGYKVLLGEIGKGEFRISLGFFGPIAYLCTKFYVPILLVYISYLYIKVKKFKYLLIINFIVAFLIGATWGFKTTSIFMIIPGLIVLLWNTKFYKILFVCLCLFLFIFGFALFFDSQNLDFRNTLNAIFVRLTIIQGDMVWHMWNLHNQNTLPLENYLVTLFSAIGDKLLNLLLTFTEEEWIFYHYHLIITYFSGYDDAGLSTGHSVTGNIFGESISIAKYPINNLFAILAGIIVGLNIKLLKLFYKNNYPILLSLSVVFFISFIYPWLNAGGIVTLIHISSLFAIFTGLLLLKIIYRIAK